MFYLLSSRHHYYYLVRRVGMLLALVAMALMVFATGAFAAAQLFTGTDGNDKLVGTPERDIITGGAGNDITKGRGGNDVYRYSDGWGDDALIDTGGIDTLDFRTTTKDLRIELCPELDPNEEEPNEGGMVQVIGASDRVVYDVGFLPQVTQESNIEIARGGSGNDGITGCSGPNIMAGRLGTNWLSDSGGDSEINLPPSNDVYRVNPRSSTSVYDSGGEADVLHINKVSSDQVQMYRYGREDGSVTNSLLLCHGGKTLVSNQFGPVEYDVEDRHIESIILKDKTIHPEVASLSVAEDCQ
jgi:Ca2+-binding RTX toxin-like protein